MQRNVRRMIDNDIVGFIKKMARMFSYLGHY